MTWFLIALGAPILWAFVNITDKYLVEKYSTGHHDSGGLIIFSSLVGILIAGFIAIFANNILGIPMSDKLLLILSGFLTIIWFILYLYALEIEEISAIVPWFVIVPVFGYIFGYLFLGETLTTHQLIGSGIVLLGVFLISIDFMGEKRKIKVKPALYMLCASIMIAISGVIFKCVTIGGDFWVSSFWEYLGMGTMGILIFLFIPKIRKEFIYMNEKGGVKIFALNMISEFTSTIASLMTNFALLLAPVTMVYLVGSFQPAILLFLTILGTKFFPKIITENMHHKVLVPKTIAIIVIIVGSIFLFT
jgi:uncharacterized membrane protein